MADDEISVGFACGAIGLRFSFAFAQLILTVLVSLEVSLRLLFVVIGVGVFVFLFLDDVEVSQVFADVDFLCFEEGHGGLDLSGFFAFVVGQFVEVLLLHAGEGRELFFLELVFVLVFDVVFRAAEGLCNCALPQHGRVDLVDLFNDLCFLNFFVGEGVLYVVLQFQFFLCLLIVNCVLSSGFVFDVAIGGGFIWAGANGICFVTSVFGFGGEHVIPHRFLQGNIFYF